jgi:hypothetical protein
MIATSRTFLTPLANISIDAIPFDQTIVAININIPVDLLAEIIEIIVTIHINTSENIVISSCWEC